MNVDEVQRRLWEQSREPKNMSSKVSFSMLQVFEHSCGHGDVDHGFARLGISLVIFRVTAIF
jgi:hypothetical protein